ncbi:hypothetical protein QPK87_19180 [Kamptonema cortianum]|nr:hypothetical protein [Geitlerinema splendidum]MDK3158679.1 hypothetical protein [Kamptonema cortianum]
MVARLGRATRSLLSLTIGLALAFFANAGIIRAFPAAFPWLKAIILVTFVGITYYIIDKALMGKPGS